MRAGRVAEVRERLRHDRLRLVLEVQIQGRGDLQPLVAQRALTEAAAQLLRDPSEDEVRSLDLEAARVELDWRGERGV